MNNIISWFADTLGNRISPQAVVFIVSMIPVLECRGGLIVASLLGVDIRQAVPLCILGNFLPIPLLLLFIRRIFSWLKRFKKFRPFIEKLEKRAMNKSGSMKNGEFLGLLLFVGIPLPGTGGWTGSLAAALLEIDFKKALLAIIIGILLATVIMSVVSYGLLATVLKL